MAPKRRSSRAKRRSSRKLPKSCRHKRGSGGRGLPPGLLKQAHGDMKKAWRLSKKRCSRRRGSRRSRR